MPFPSSLKARIFVRSARICCLCFKQCGTNIEAAHILAEADGGSNEVTNAIPLCFDCHQEMGAYDPRHPRGNHFTPEELRERRDQLYALVESGLIQAQVIASRLQSASPSSRITELPAGELEKLLSSPAGPSEEAEAFLRAALKDRAPELLPFKLDLLTETDRAHVLDSLVERFKQGTALTALMVLLSSGKLGANQLLILEQVLRKVTLEDDVNVKARFMQLVPVSLLEGIDPSLRSAFFHEVIEIMRRDQYSEVNKITPAVIRAQSAMPPEFIDDYLKALLAQAQSDAWYGAPAAQRALRDLSDGLARQALMTIERDQLVGNESEHLKTFVRDRQSLWHESQKNLFEDYLALDVVAFLEKYYAPDLVKT